MYNKNKLCFDVSMLTKVDDIFTGWERLVLNKIFYCLYLILLHFSLGEDTIVPIDDFSHASGVISSS
jgi:hypothetical protein